MKITKMSYSGHPNKFYWTTGVDPVLAGVTGTRFAVIKEHLHADGYLIWL